MNKNKNIIISGPHKDFESIKKVDENGIEYWDARELMPLLGYEQWRRFEEVIKRAEAACVNSGQDFKNHFADAGKMVGIGSETVREVADYKLDRYACYRGLYGMPLTDIEKKKGVKKGELLDRAGSTELAANLFRITQTDEKIKKDNVQGQENASRVHFKVGGKIRETIKDIGGMMPEHLPVEKHIKDVKREVKKLGGKEKKKQ